MSGNQGSGSAGAAGGGAVYGLGLIGALIFYFQQADSFWEFILGFFQALVWPAFLVYELFVSTAS